MTKNGVRRSETPHGVLRRPYGVLKRRTEFCGGRKEKKTPHALRALSARRLTFPPISIWVSLRANPRIIFISVLEDVGRYRCVCSYEPAFSHEGRRDPLLFSEARTSQEDTVVEEMQEDAAEAVPLQTRARSFPEDDVPR